MKQISRHERYIQMAVRGTADDVRHLMSRLSVNEDIPTLKTIDLALGYINSTEGVEAMSRYLFEGTAIQRNYCTNYFRRKGNRIIIREAWEAGAIDEIQAFSR